MPLLTSSGAFSSHGYGPVNRTLPTYSQVQIISPPSIYSSSIQSSAISGDGNYIALMKASGSVGSPNYLYVYKYNGSTYTLYSTITDNSYISGALGMALNYDGSYLVFNSQNGGSPDSMFIYFNNGTTFSLQQTFTYSQSITQSWYDFSRNGDYLAVGFTAPSGFPFNTAIYFRSGTTWSLQYSTTSGGRYNITINDAGDIFVAGGTVGGSVVPIAGRRSGTTWTATTVPTDGTTSTNYRYVDYTGNMEMVNKKTSSYNGSTWSTLTTAMNANSPYTRGVMAKDSYWASDFSVDGSQIILAYSLTVYYRYGNYFQQYANLPQSPSITNNTLQMSFDASAIIAGQFWRGGSGGINDCYVFRRA